ncbi:membrane protein [Ktedonobacter sp. SOSP1-52]|uniref:permease n=1 Tax=Ktedonobacter sp. SOSP1-52 TaxID=2778366 RepID=UPI0019156CCB|nr:permease [Ktedonobacter sp. SOSP1-52]GHO62804.1 membrane protein [Ktedonobacter sp. SOSP1-52]
MYLITAILQALSMALSMCWEILWPLILGFALSGIVQAVVSHKTMAQALGGDSPKNLTLATLFGIASSSCSYAAVALARSIFQKGASFTSAMVFELASTNLVIELGIILIVLMGWQFAAAEYLGGLLMVIFLAVIFRLTLTPRLVQQAKEQAAKGVMGRMEGHAAMDMSVEGGSFWQKLFSGKGFTAVSHYFVMDWASVWVDIALGLLIAGALAAWVPESFWQAFFLSNNPTLAKIEGPLVGPLVAIFSFVCSVGNVPLAAVLWRGGISFGGVVSFIFADLIILPILDIYRKYYGWKMIGYILVTFYVTMAAAGYVVEFLFAALGIIPQNRNVATITEGFQWNYTSILNIIFLVLAAILVIRFLRTGGPAMLKMMNGSGHKMSHDDEGHHTMHHHEHAS